MPSFVAALIASLAGWLAEDALRGALGPIASMSASLLVAAVAFFLAKQLITDLRAGG